MQQEKLKEIKARLNFRTCSRRNSKVQEVSQHSEIRRDRSESPRHRPGGKGIRNGGVFNRLGDKGNSVSTHSESRYYSERTEFIPKRRHQERTCSWKPETLSESEDGGGGH
ncbi:hypothetical protein Tco_0255096 [Tanacetum coccineum]